MESYPRLNISKGQLVDFCQRHHIRKLSLFGSILRDDFGPDSDIDFLVEFEPSAIPGLFEVAGIEIELSAMLGHKVDMRTLEDLSPYFRQDVLDTAELQYEKR
ncbi:MAG: nucleotidyltransferase domain-containing protein [Anaerolineae bacterium]|nr:nucleotidyltransferase domain-containing protein [Anaerolineae bacterium]